MDMNHITDSNEKSNHKPLEMCFPLIPIPGPWACQHTASPTYPLPLLCGHLPVCTHRDCISRLWQVAVNVQRVFIKPGGQGNITNTSSRVIFGKTKERLPEFKLVSCMIQRRHTSLGALPQYRARSMEQVYQ